MDDTCFKYNKLTDAESKKCITFYQKESDRVST
jgi:hypothetical protein